MIINQTDQVLNCQIILTNDNKSFLSSFIYAGNQFWYCKTLSKDLDIHKNFINKRPWVLLGDFNVSLNIEDTSTGTSGITYGMKGFKSFVENIEVEDMNKVRLHYTWNQRPNATAGILKKLDRIMCKESFSSIFSNVYADFQPYRISDHSPAILKIPLVNNTKPKPFKFANFIVHKEGFSDIVRKGWSIE